MTASKTGPQDPTIHTPAVQAAMLIDAVKKALFGDEIDPVALCAIVAEDPAMLRRVMQETGMYA